MMNGQVNQNTFKHCFLLFEYSRISLTALLVGKC